MSGMRGKGVLSARDQAGAMVRIGGVLSIWCALMFAIVIGLLGVLTAGTARAHEMSPAIADVTVSAETVTIDLSLYAEALVAGVDLAQFKDTNDAPEGREYDTLRALPPVAFESRFRAAWPLIAQGLEVSVTGHRVQPLITKISVEDGLDQSLPRRTFLTLEAELPVGADPVIVGWDAAYGPMILRQMSAAKSDGELYSAFLEYGARSAPLPRDGVAQTGWIANFVDYIVIGFAHIIPKGLDHILFVLGLFFFSLRLKVMVLQATVFTLAHSVTLALASLGWVSIPGSIVEPLIAASIVFIAAENVLQREVSKLRYGVIFLFGLLHGLGFASVLGDVGMSAGHFLSSLIAFNIGVEIGQVVILAAAYALVGIWFGEKPWYRKRIAIPASTAIGLIGLWWVFERVILS